MNGNNEEEKNREKKGGHKKRTHSYITQIKAVNKLNRYI